MEKDLEIETKSCSRHELMNHLNVIYALCCLEKEDSLDRIKAYILKVKDEVKENS